MRPIEFRGKRVDNEEWAYGFYYRLADGQTFTYEGVYDRSPKHFIVVDTGFRVEIIPETVCQFTGQLDKNGVRIFEGDTCAFYWNPITNDPSSIFKLIAPVVFYKKWCCFCYKITPISHHRLQLELFESALNKGRELYVAVGSPQCGYGLHDDSDDEYKEIEVIGNIHEDGGLLNEN